VADKAAPVFIKQVPLPLALRARACGGPLARAFCICGAFLALWDRREGVGVALSTALRVNACAGPLSGAFLHLRGGSGIVGSTGLDCGEESRARFHQTGPCKRGSSSASRVNGLRRQPTQCTLKEIWTRNPLKTPGNNHLRLEKCVIYKWDC
jgi:hypothetical protein